MVVEAVLFEESSVLFELVNASVLIDDIVLLEPAIWLAISLLE